MSGKEIMETRSGISRRGIYVTLTIVAALIAVFGYLSFEWLFCRFYVPARLYGGGHRQIGAGTPRAGSILVEEGEKGIPARGAGRGKAFPESDPVRRGNRAGGFHTAGQGRHRVIEE